MSQILVTGASGPIGAALLPSLRKSGHKVVRFVRSAVSGPDEISWDPAQPIAPESVSRFDAVVHLAGETIVGRWTEAKKKRILESRRVGTKNLAEALARAPRRPQAFIAASAIGFYGNRGDEILREDSSHGHDFLSEVCREWEAAADPAQQAGIRTANLRFGVILSTQGGALKQMLLPFRLGLGGRIGDGRQWWSWIDINDVVGAIVHAMKTDLLHGPVNAVAPRPVRNSDFTQVLARVLHRPALFPVPAFAARMAFGEMADELLLASQRVEPAKLISSGYPFQYSELQASLRKLLQG